MAAEQIRITAEVLPLVITGGVVLLVLALIQLYLGLRAQKNPKVTGEDSMIGETGLVRKAAGFRARSIVEIRGELWWCIPARRDTVLKEGDTVRVVAITQDSLILEVDNTV